MGGLLQKNKSLFVFFMIGSLALGGFPTFSGSFSKDLIITAAFDTARISGNTCAAIAFFSLVFGAALTVAYSTRLIYYVFLRPKNITTVGEKNYVYPDLITLFSLLVLAVFSLVIGYYSKIFFYFYNTLCYLGRYNVYCYEELGYSPPSSSCIFFNSGSLAFVENILFVIFIICLIILK